MNKGGILSGEEALESGTSLAKKAGKSVGSAITGVSAAASSQITGASNDKTDSDKASQDIVKSLYATSDEKDKLPKNTSPKSSDDSLKNKNFTPEEIAKLNSLKAKLHNEVYYQPLINPQRGQPEERPADKVEKEKQEEMMELQEKKKKETPALAIVRGQKRIESPVGNG